MNLIRVPRLLRKLYPGKLIWQMRSSAEPTVYLTFDDGPHPEVTPFVLEQLQKYNAQATFFCIGRNVAAYPDVYRSVLQAGHVAGNHTFNHLNGWKTGAAAYIHDVLEASAFVENRIFRPPYGRISFVQANMLTNTNAPWKIYMWDVLSYDFDSRVNPEQCLQHVVLHARPGSIVVFHDSEKARERLEYALPRFLAFCVKQKWNLKSLPV